jgi:transposase InsO family protein
MGRPSHSPERLKEARSLVFDEMKSQGSPGWRPISAALKGKVSVRLVQRFVAEYKLEQRKKRNPKRMEVAGKNVIWSMDGAITKDESKVENQVIKDRGSKCWVGLRSSQKASKAVDVIEALDESIKQNGYPLVLSTDNGAAYTNKEVCRHLRKLKIIHLKSLPRTPQHNGAVEVGIRELREIMLSKEINLKDAMIVSNARLRKYGNKWMSSQSIFENGDVLYNKRERELFYKKCTKQLSALAKQPLNLKEKRMKERELVLNELQKRGLVTEWKVTKNG